MNENERKATGTFWLYAFATPFCLVGVITAVVAVGGLTEAPIDFKKVGLSAVCALVFGGAGFGMIGLVRWGARIARARDARRETHPDKPWMWREDWADGRARCESVSRAAVLWAFGLFWNLVSTPVCVFVPEELESGNWAALAALLFPLIGIGLLIAATRATLAWRKFGRAVFELAETPGRLGGRLSGAIRIDVKVIPEDGFHLVLRCIRKPRRNDDDSAAMERVLWEEEQTMARELLERDPRFTAIPVCFDLPEDAGPATDEEANSPIVWSLEARARVSGLDFERTFEVPVFPRSGVGGAPEASEAASREENDVDPVAEYRAPESAPRPEEFGIRVDESTRGELEIVFRACRNPSAAISAGIFTSILAGAIWVQVVLGAPLLFPIVTGIATLFLSLISFELLFSATRVRAEDGVIRVMTSHLGIGGITKIPMSDVAEIRTSIGMRSGKTAYYDIEIVKAGSKTIYAGRHVRDKRLAEWLVDRLSEAVTESAPRDAVPV